MSNANTFTKIFPARREIREKVRTETGFTHRSGGFLIADAYVSVDFEAIAKALGEKAMRNKSGKATYMKGAVVVTARSIRKETQAA